jgi:hemoglobin
MYPQADFEGAEQRLRQFLIYRFGGSDEYIQQAEEMQGYLAYRPI